MIAPDRSTLAPAARVLGPLCLAAAFECAGWILLAQPGVLLGSWYGRAALLQGVHALTLGALALSVTGAGWQLVPVVTARPWSPALAPWVNRGLILGLLAMLPAFSRPSGALAVAGLTLVLSSLLLRSALVLPALLRATGRAAPRLWLIGAELSLWLGLGLGLALWLGRAGHPVLTDPIGALAWHVRALLGGWLAGWMIGTGSLLIPMFAVSREPEPRALLGAGALWIAGLATGLTALWALGLVMGGGCVALSLSRGARRGPALAQAGIGVLGLALFAALSPLGWLAPDAIVTGALALGALPLLRGVAQRILPFLAWTHAYGANMRGAPPVSRLGAERLGALSGALGLAGGAAVLASRIWPSETLGRAGAWIAALGALLHLLLLARALLLGWLGQNRGQALAGTERA